MCTITLIILTTLVAEAHAGLQVLAKPSHQRVLNRFPTPQKPHLFHVLQQSIHQLPHQTLPYRHTSGSSIMPSVVTQAEKSAVPERAPDVMSKDGGTFDWLFMGVSDSTAPMDPDKLTVNAYDEAVGPCKVPDYCMFTDSSPKVCVSFLEDGSDNRCISIFEYSKTNKWRASMTQEPISEKYKERAIPGMNFPQLAPKCDAVPTNLLESSFSKDMWSSCEVKFKEYRYVSPKSSKFGSENTKVVGKSPFFINKPSLKEFRPEEISSQCDRFRDAIKSICDTCGSVAPSATAKDTLASKCAAIQGDSAELFTQTSPDALSVPSVALICLFVAISVSFAMLRLSRRTPTEAGTEEPFLPQ